MKMEWKKIKKLNDYFNWKTGNGIFYYLQELDVPWKNLDISNILDMQYHGNYSGSKVISPLVEAFLTDDIILTEEDKKTLAMTLYELYKVQWDRLYKILSLEYNPIENYNGIEVEDITDNYKGSNTGTQQSDSDNQVYGYNSTNAVDDSKSTNLRTDDLKSETDRTYHREWSRHGNIGVTTSQQMIESEIELWKWNFFESVFKDIDTILTLPIYIKEKERLLW